MFIARFLQVLSNVTEACRSNQYAEQLLGRKKVGDHVIKVTLVAEREGSGAPAPITTHSARPPGIESD